MSIREWIELDIDQMELEQVSESEKKRVKHHVLNKKKKGTAWKKFVVAAAILISAVASTTFAFPSVASQLPFMDNVISYFKDEDKQYINFESFSSEIGLVQADNGITIMIDNAVYDGTNITVSYAIETEHDFGDTIHVRAPNWFEVAGSKGSGGTGGISKISDSRYVGFSSFTPHFKSEEYPEIVNITWEPKGFYNPVTNTEVEGDWSFDFSLDRLEGNLQLVNETITNTEVSFTLSSIEFTDVSTIISYHQSVQDSLLKDWESVSPVFYITDNLGNKYMDGIGGLGTTDDDYKTFKGTTSFGAIHKDATQLIIQPTEVASLLYGKGHIEIKLNPIVIDIK